MPGHLSYKAWRFSVMDNCCFNSCIWFLGKINWQEFLGSIGKCHNFLVLISESLVLTDRTCCWNSKDCKRKFLHILKFVFTVTYWDWSMENGDGVLDHAVMHNCNLVRCHKSRRTRCYFASFVNVDRRVYQIYDRSMLLAVSCKLKIYDESALGMKSKIRI